MAASLKIDILDNVGVAKSSQHLVLVFRVVNARLVGIWDHGDRFACEFLWKMVKVVQDIGPVALPSHHFASLPF